MALPEPTPALRGKDAREFEERLKKFRLSSVQRDFYADAEAEFLKSREKKRARN